MKHKMKERRRFFMTSIFFSPRGTTKRVARTIAQDWPARREQDLIYSPLTQELEIPAEEPVLVCLPVYYGRIPALCRTMLRTHLKGRGGPALAVVVYGNRAYDDALLELTDLLTECGFRVAGAAAFVARHSIYTRVAADRPDAGDRAVMAEFAARCRTRIQAGAWEPVEVPGDPDYRSREIPQTTVFPDCNDRCMKCYACFRACPTRAIPEEAPWQTDHTRCINCGACIFLCPTQARDHRGEKFQEKAKLFEEKCAPRREPEYFL